MKCTVNGGNARVIAKAIQSLSKIGTDLFVEATQDGLQLRSINSSQSAVGTIKFNTTFFDCYDVTANDENYCKLTMKSCLSIFKSMKQVEHCELKIVPEHSKFQVTLKCKLETIRTASISIVDEENINADVPMPSNGNVIIGSHKLFTEISTNFNTSEEEMTFEVCKDGVTAKNFIEGSRVNEKFMRSQLKLRPGEFDSYRVSQETTITFCLKEFRAFLMFAESINASLDLNFEESGSPLLVRIINGSEIECVLILSTLSPEDVSFYEDNTQTNSNDTTVPNSALKRKHSNSKNQKSTITQQTKRLADVTTQSSNSTILFQFNSSQQPTFSSSAHSVNAARNCIDPRNSLDDNEAHNALLLNQTAFTSRTASPPATGRAAAVQQESEVIVTFLDTEEDQNEPEESIPQSPQRQQERRNFRSIFSRCFESTYVPKEPSPDSQVYVPDSDEEN